MAKLNRRIVEQVINYCESTGEFKPVNRTELSKQIKVHRYTILRWFWRGLEVKRELDYNQHFTPSEYEELCFLIMVALRLAEHRQQVIDHQRIVNRGKRTIQRFFWRFNESGIQIPQALMHNFDFCVHADDQDGLSELDEWYY